MISSVKIYGLFSFYGKYLLIACRVRCNMFEAFQIHKKKGREKSSVIKFNKITELISLITSGILDIFNTTTLHEK